MKKTRKLLGIAMAAALAAGLVGFGSGQTASTAAPTAAAKPAET